MAPAVAGLAAAVAVVGALLGVPLAAAVGLAMALGILLARRVKGMVTALPAAVVVLLAACLAIGQVAALLGWGLLSELWTSRAVIAALGVVVLVAAWRLHHAGQRAARSEPQACAPAGTTRGEVTAAMVPAAVLVAFMVAYLFLPPAHRFQWFLGGDNLRHIIFAADVWQAGALDYGPEVYPRAWHTAVALLWSTTGPALDASGLLGLIGLMAAGMWLVYAVLALATALLAGELAGNLGLPGTAWRAGAAITTGAVTLSPPFLSVYLANGFENSIVAALVLAAGARELTASCGTLRSVVVTACGVAVMAHTWQLLMPAALLVCCATAVACLRSGSGRPAGYGLGSVVGLLVVACLLAAPGLVAVAKGVGLNHSTDADIVAEVPLFWLGAASCAALMAVIFRWRDGSVVVVALMVLGTALSAVLLAALYGISPLQYYPSKLLWQATILGLPVAAAMVAWLAVMLRRWSLTRPALTRTLVRPGAVVARAALGIGLAFAMVNPLAAVLGKWSPANGEQVLAAIMAPSASRAQVVWTGDREDDTIARILLDFYRVGDTRQRTLQPPLSVAEECTLLGQAIRPTVLSDAPLAQVRERYAACAGGSPAVVPLDPLAASTR